MLDQFQQRKQAEELTNGMALHNTALEQLDHKIKEEEIIMVSAQAAGDEAASSAAKFDDQKHQYPSSTLRYSLSLALQEPQAVKKEKVDNCEIRVRKAKQLCRDQKGAS